MCLGMANGGKISLTREDIIKKLDNEERTIIINNVKILYDNYKIGNENGEDIIYFYNECGFCFIGSVFFKDIVIEKCEGDENA